MARMHARKKGRSGSTKPLSKKAPGWVGYNATEVEKLIIKLAKQGNGSAKIGLILRERSRSGSGILARLMMNF